MSFFLKKIALTQFRNYTSTRLNLTASPVVLTGANGAGKTNILEAISLLTPGRGLRRAKMNSVKNIYALPAEYWAISAELETARGLTRIGTGQHPTKPNRVIRINGKDQKSQNNLAKISAILWLTPQMDGLFLDSPSVRRRFLDRMVANFTPKHQSQTARYDKLLRERSIVLKEQRHKADPHWLKSLEIQIAELGVSIAAARHTFCLRLEEAINRLEISETDFPRPRLEIHGIIEEHLKQNAAVDTEDFFAKRLENSRHIDQYTGGAQDGTHKSDFKVVHDILNIPAENCSTGEQKGLLIKLILGQAALVKAERGFSPLLLLDDIAAHLDPRRRDILFDTVMRLNCQSWMTGTEASDFAPLKQSAQFFDVISGHVQTRTPQLIQTGS